MIGPGIPGWEDRHHRYGEHKLNLAGLPDPIGAELAWMAYWQETIDGTPASVQPINQLAVVLRLAQRLGHPFPASIRQMDADTADRLSGHQGCSWLPAWHVPRGAVVCVTDTPGGGQVRAWMTRRLWWATTREAARIGRRTARAFGHAEREQHEAAEREINEAARQAVAEAEMLLRHHNTE